MAVELNCLLEMCLLHDPDTQHGPQESWHSFLEQGLDDSLLFQQLHLGDA